MTAFISSVMTPELEPVRSAAIAAIEQASNIAPWAFEASPASSEPVVEGYLRKVREADFVIWLVGETTTQPVEAEINEALSAGRRLLVFLLPADERDKRTGALLDRVRSRVRYRELTDIAEIGAELKAAIADEMSRALRGPAKQGKPDWVSALWRASHARCIEKWQAAGLTGDLAITLAADSRVGALPDGLLPNSNRPLTVLVGEAGSGKSLGCERYLQNSIRNLGNNPSGPIPVFLPATEALGNLRQAVESDAKPFGDPTVQGLRLVLDGADEAGVRSQELLSEARRLVRAWPDAQIVLASRPHSTYVGIEEVVHVPLLDDQHALKIVGIGAGREIAMGEHASWAEPIKEAIRLPFFALLVGERLRRTEDLRTSRTELLADLADRSVGSHGADALKLLQQLALLSIERGGTRIPLSELGGPSKIDALQSSRLVVVSDGLAWFPLAITAQWLAAAALAEGLRSGEPLAGNPRDLELWRYPLAMLIANYSHDQVTRVLGPIAERHPGFVTQIVDESIARWSGKSESAIPPAEAGLRIRQAMSYWASGFGDLAPVLVPGFNANTGQLPPLGVAKDGPRLMASWYEGDNELEEVHHLPVELFFSGSETPIDRGWRWIRSVDPPIQAAWGWRWTFEELSNRLRECIEDRSLPVAGTRLEHPRIWLASIGVLGLPGSHAQPLSISRIRERAIQLQPMADPNLRGYGSHAINLERLVEILDRMTAEGHILLQPARLETEPSGNLFLPGSAVEEVRRGRITDVYQAALECYEELCDGLFAGLASFMPIAARLPVRFDGHLYARGPGPHPPQSFEWSMFALAYGTPSTTEITITSEGDPERTGRWREDWIKGAEEATKSLKSLRPEQSRWLGMGFSDKIWEGVGHLAMEEIVYDWLWSDLTHLRLVKGGLLPEAPYKTIP